jgi:regulator of protease activity HflC (stomatin/prohibitin superfamily)
MALSLENFFTALLNNLKSLLPFRIIHDYEQAVRFSFGHAGPTIHGTKCGWCLFVPLVQTIQIVDATWGQVSFDTQSIETNDNIQLSVSGATVYKVSDARSYLLSVFDTDAAATLRAIGKGCISSVLLEKTYNEVCANKESTEGEIAERLRRELDRWGLNIHKVHLHDIVRTKNIRLHGLSQPPRRDNWE